MNCHLNEKGLLQIKDVVAHMNPRIKENNSLSVILQECEKRPVNDIIVSELASVFKNIVHVPLDTPSIFVQSNLEMAMAVIHHYDDCDSIFISDACDYAWSMVAMMFQKQLVEEIKEADLVILSTETEKNIWQGDHPHCLSNKKVHWDITHGGLYDYLQDQKSLVWDTASLWVGHLVSPDIPLKMIVGIPYSIFDEFDSRWIAKCYFGLLHLGINGILSSFMLRCRIAHHLATVLGPTLTISAVQDPRGYQYESPLAVPAEINLQVEYHGPIVSILGATPYCRMERWKYNVPLMETMEAISVAVPWDVQDQEQWVQTVAKELLYNLNHGLFIAKNGN